MYMNLGGRFHRAPLVLLPISYLPLPLASPGAKDAGITHCLDRSTDSAGKESAVVVYIGTNDFENVIMWSWWKIIWS